LLSWCLAKAIHRVTSVGGVQNRTPESASVCPLKLLFSEGLMRVQIIGVAGSDVSLFWCSVAWRLFYQRKSGHSLPIVQRVDCFSEVDDVLEVMSR
jgi:hypothetical protein